jgi:hypothetical protein
MKYLGLTILFLTLNIAAWANDAAPTCIYYSVVTQRPQRKASTLPNNKGQIRIDQKLRKELNDWFSVFAQTELKSFERDKVKDETLIAFALDRIFTYDEFKERIVGRIGASPECAIDQSIVEAVVAKYFEAKIKQHKSAVTNTYRSGYGDPRPYTREYKNGCYSAAPVDDASGELTVRFSKITKLRGLGNRYYEARVDVYVGEDADPVPVNVSLLSKMRVVFKQVPARDADKFLLVSYQKAR